VNRSFTFEQVLGAFAPTCSCLNFGKSLKPVSIPYYRASVLPGAPCLPELSGYVFYCSFPRDPALERCLGSGAHGTLSTGQNCQCFLVQVWMGPEVELAISSQSSRTIYPPCQAASYGSFCLVANVLVCPSSRSCFICQKVGVISCFRTEVLSKLFHLARRKTVSTKHVGMCCTGLKIKTGEGLMQVPF